MTEKKYRELHRELWQWLVDNPEKEKSDWPKWSYLSPITNDCFACAFAKQVDGYLGCKNCPITWPKVLYDGISAFCGDSYYAEWKYSTDTEEQKKLAAWIRDAWPEEKK